MKKILFLSFFLFHLINVSQAQYQPQGGTTIVQLGYANLKPEGLDIKLDGFAFNLGYEYLTFKKKFAYGFSISYIEGTGSEGNSSYKYHTWPLNFYGKYFVGKEKFRAYLKGQFGFHSTTSQTEALVLVKYWDTGITAGGGVGVNYVLNQRIFLNLEYNATWIDSNIFQDDLIHVLTLGIGIMER